MWKNNNVAKTWTNNEMELPIKVAKCSLGSYPKSQEVKSNSNDIIE